MITVIYIVSLVVMALSSYILGGMLCALVFRILVPPPTDAQVRAQGRRWATGLRAWWR